MASTSIEATELFVRTIADVAIQNEKYFADLDGVCGDGDFGISLAAGFTKVMEQWDALDRSSPGAMLKGVSMAIASRSAASPARSGAPPSCAPASSPATRRI